MNLNQWAIKWGIPYAAVEDLRREFGMVNLNPEPPIKGNNEAAVQSRVRLEASHAGGVLWRHNVGGTLDDRGNFIRYGLANDSKQMNASFKSSDLIGIRPVRITSEMVGGTIGQFIAREVKAPTWSYSGKAREVAQLKFLELVVSMGGDACFATGGGTIDKNVTNE